MFATRILIVALTLTFLLGALISQGIGMLETVVVMCPLLYMILDIKVELQSLRLLKARVSSLSRSR
jgi:hypothetical protein